MPSIPEPRDHAERHAPKCTRHHVHMVNCPDCCAWHRDLLRHEREAADQRQASRETTR